MLARFDMFERHATDYRHGEPLSVFEVDNGFAHTWGHARSLRYLLNMTDGDGVPRRLDFVGTVENLARDLRHVLRLLHVGDESLSEHQRQFFAQRSTGGAAWSGVNARNNNRHMNKHEGFREANTLPPMRDRLVRHLSGAGAGRASLEKIAARYRADFECLGYSPHEWVSQ